MKRRAQGGHKYIFVVGGVMSGVGKGIATASIGKLLTARGLSVNLVKIDPYLNVDAGTMNPIEHGEVFVLDSGLETDQDMGNYERFLGRDEGPDDYMTSGMVYASVIARERNLGYGGKCVETIPHVRDEVIDRLKRAASVSGSDVSVIEIGGTVGDFQNALYVDAARVMHLLAPGDTLFVMVSYLPVPGTLGEMKTKPTQNAVRMLNSYGVQPDVIIARSKRPLDRKRKEKLAISCNVHPDMIISAPDVESIYDVPLNFERDKLSDILLEALGEEGKQPADLSVWKEFAEHAHDGDGRVKVGIVGKYFDTGDFVLSDAYISVIEALKFSAYAHGVHPELHWLNAKDYEADPKSVSELNGYDGIHVTKLDVLAGVPDLKVCVAYQIGKGLETAGAVVTTGQLGEEPDQWTLALSAKFDPLPELSKVAEMIKKVLNSRTSSSPKPVEPGVFEFLIQPAHHGKVSFAKIQGEISVIVAIQKPTPSAGE